MAANLLAKVRTLMSEGKGDRVIAETLDVTRHEARKLIREVEMADKGNASGPVEIPVASCKASPTARPIKPGHVLVLAESIKEIGLRQPINVRAIEGGYEIRGGGHRHAAFVMLERETIPAIVTDDDDLRAELAEIDENLIRNDLSPAERASAQARRKAVYQQLHPEVTHGGDRRSSAQVEHLKDSPPRYDEATAEAVGVSPQTIRRDVHRGETLGEAALGKIARTSLDSGAEMDALIKLPEEKRQALIERAAEGEQVSAQAEVEKPGAPAAHMAGRVQEPGDLDYSPTPPWATRALIERVLRHHGREGHCKLQTAWEPACGEGHMAEVLREYFLKVRATDIHERNGYPDEVVDFLSSEGHFDWIITNPPFEDRVLKFMDRALDLAGTGVAMFLQLRYLEGIGRYERIYKDRPPTIIAPFVERVPLVMGRYDPEASTTTAFMWLVWLKGSEPKAPFWIPPGSAKALTKPDDAERFTQNPVRKRNEATAISEGEAA